VSFGIVDDTGDGIALSFIEFSCSESWVESEYFTDEEAESSADSFDFIECEGNGSFSIDVGVEDTMDVFECVLCVLDDE
jgi:hypothetical protein